MYVSNIKVLKEFINIDVKMHDKFCAKNNQFTYNLNDKAKQIKEVHI